ncbi:hypothetical protein LCGC14_1111300 [marine sediment metagenome]|uniref:Uncharacterized protein n=1 Tax=marine sediment metagenome TaxID=412755 RepID=A0A0F9MBE3_9ZZZZ
MATLIPEVTITDFKRLKVDEIKQLKSCEVTSDGEYLFTFLNAQTDYIRAVAEDTGQTSNSVSGETLEEIKGAELATVSI